MTMLPATVILTALKPAAGGRFTVGRAQELGCQVEQAWIRVEILGRRAQPLREYAALLTEAEDCEPPCRFDVRLPAHEPALPRQYLHYLAYFFRREAGLVHIAKPAGQAIPPQP